MEIHKEKDLQEVRKTLKKEQRALTVKKFLHNRLAMSGAVILLFVVVIALAAPILSPTDPLATEIVNRLAPPSFEHPFGTDAYGRDVFSRVLYGTRISLAIGAAVAIVSGAVGTIVGLCASYYRWLDNVLMRICDGIMAIPAIVLAIALLAVMGSSVFNLILCLSIASVPDVARVVRSKALLIREQSYIEAMRTLGASNRRIILGHMMPNVVSVLIVQLTFIFAAAILAEAGLSFLGVGVPLPTPSLGSIIFDGKAQIYTAWWLVAFPGVTMVLTVLGLNLFGDGVRDVLDPMTN